MGNDSWDWIALKKIKKFGEDDISVFFLEFGLHVVRDLSDCVAGSISHHWVFVSEEANDHGEH